MAALLRSRRASPSRCRLLSEPIFVPTVSARLRCSCSSLKRLMSCNPVAARRGCAVQGHAGLQTLWESALSHESEAGLNIAFVPIEIAAGLFVAAAAEHPVVHDGFLRVRHEVAHGRIERGHPGHVFVYRLAVEVDGDECGMQQRGTAAVENPESRCLAARDLRQLAQRVRPEPIIERRIVQGADGSKAAIRWGKALSPAIRRPLDRRGRFSPSGLGRGRNRRRDSPLCRSLLGAQAPCMQ